MRRNVIYGLIGLLIIVIALDFQTTTDSRPSNRLIIPDTVPIAATAAPTAIAEVTVITATPNDEELQQVSLTLTAMAAAPSLTPTTIISEGQTITHSLQRGETLFSLAQVYGTTVDAIMSANNIVDPTRLRVGTLLTIPGTTGSIPSVTPVQVVSVATAQAASAPTATPGTIVPANVQLPTNFNGLDFAAFVVMPPSVRQNVREIYAEGQALGNNPRAFSRLGDSTIEHPYFLARFDNGPYNLGSYAYLQQVIEYYAGSFDHAGVAVRRGLHTWSVLDSMWAPKPLCGAGEHMLACEFRRHRPSILFIRLGSNDVGIPDSTNRNLREIVDYTINSGVIPIIGTKADRHDGPNNTNNNIMRQIATDYAIPLWDYDLIAGTIPGRGLDIDGVHMTTFFAHDYTSPVALTRGHGVHNLTALMMLDAIWRELNQ